MAPVLLLGLLMKFRHLLCKSMIALKIGDLNCDQCKAIQACWGIDISEDALKSYDRQSRNPVEPSAVSAKEIISKQPECASFWSIDEKQGMTGSEDELEFVAED